MKAAIFTVICFFALTAGCTRTVHVPHVSYYREVDTITQTIADSSVIKALIECDENNRVILRELSETKGEAASQQLYIDNGQIKIVTRWQTEYIDRVREIHDTVTVIEAREVTKTVKHVPKFFLWCFGIALISAGYTVLRILRHLKIP